MSKNKNPSTEELLKLEQIIRDKVEKCSANWFYRILYSQDWYSYEDNDTDDLVTEAKFVLDKLEFHIGHDLSLGDGNDWTITFVLPNSFKEQFVTINGYYSSQGDSEFQEVYYSSPYVYREVRYERKVAVDTNSETV